MSEIIVEKDLAEDLESNYSDYALMVIRERAISNIEDNQKPSSLAVIYSMYDMGIFSSGKHAKCAKIVGYAIGNITGHGDSSAYGALVTMTQDFGNNIPYISPNGNFGSISGDSEASFRYCCTGDTLIKTKEHYDITLKELAEINGLYEFGEKEIDINVASMNGKIVHSSKIIHSGEWPIYRLELMNGNYLEGSENHPVLTIENLKYKWKRLDEITSNDVVVLDATQHEYIEDNDLKEARFLGAMISEGCITTQNRICVNNTEYEMVDVVRRFVQTNQDANITKRYLKSGKIIYEFMFCNKE